MPNTLDKLTQSSMTPEDALEILKKGNDRFQNNLKMHRDLLEQVNRTRDGQWPFACILSCIDSRTSSELIFDLGLAGNIVNTDILGSMEFACKVAGSKLIVVLGHTKCGAIKGACDHVEMGNLTELLSKIQPSIYEERSFKNIEDRNSSNSEFVEKVATINVKRTLNSILERSNIIEHLVAEKKLAIVGAMYDVDTGKVEFYDENIYSH
jgi:carbonic anhydrase